VVSSLGKATAGWLCDWESCYVVGPLLNGLLIIPGRREEGLKMALIETTETKLNVHMERSINPLPVRSRQDSNVAGAVRLAWENIIGITLRYPKDL
jgi:hypothetical protein